MSAVCIPAAPLVAWIDRTGLSDLLASAGIPTYDPDRANERSLEMDRYQRNVNRSAKRGWFDFYWADEFIVEILGVHPYAVYGDAWFEIPDDELMQAALKAEEQAVARATDKWSYCIQTPSATTGSTGRWWGSRTGTGRNVPSFRVLGRRVA